MNWQKLTVKYNKKAVVNGSVYTTGSLIAYQNIGG